MTLASGGSYTGTQTLNNDATIANPATLSGTFSLAADVLTVTTAGGALTGGVLGADDSAFLLTGISSGQTPQISFGVKSVSGTSTATLSGSYLSVGIEAGANGPWEGRQLSLTADGSGNVTGTQTLNTAGVISASTTVTGTYTVSSGGALTIGGTDTGAISGDGDLILTTDVTSGDNPRIGIGIRRGTDESAATLSGTYTAFTYGIKSGGPGVEIDTVTFDGAGTVEGTSVVNDAGVISNNTINSAYTVASDGTLTVGNNTGAVTADGKYFVMIDMVSGDQPQIIVGIHQ